MVKGIKDLCTLSRECVQRKGYANIIQVLDKPQTILVTKAVGESGVFVLFSREKVGELIGEVGQRTFEVVELL